MVGLINYLNESLVLFLAENDALDRFLSNLENIPNCLDIVENTLLVDLFFIDIWDNSPEGREYWEYLGEKLFKENYY